MSTEETIIQQGQESLTEDTNKKDQRWKHVMLGGVPGILMGAGAFYAVDAYAHGNDEQVTVADEAAGAENAEVIDEQGAGNDAASMGNDVHVPVAHTTSDGSFADAFAAARAEVGPGGVFEWHGGIYNTYYEQEWNNMSDAQKENFAQHIKPEVSPANINTNHITEVTPTITVHSTLQDPDGHPVASTGHPADAPTTTTDTQSDGFFPEDVDFIIARIDGDEIVMVDVDQDGTPDIVTVNGVEAPEEAIEASIVETDDAGGDVDMGYLADANYDMPDYMDNVDPINV